MRRLLLITAVLLAASGSAGVRARQGPEIRIEAVVTDASGRPILDLKPADLEIKAAGSVRPIASLQLHAADPASPAARTLAIFLDEFHVAPGPNTERVRAALRRFVAEQLRPSDRVIVMKPLDSQHAIGWAPDHAAIRAAVETFQGRAGDYAPRSAFEEQYLGRAPSAVQAARAQIVTAAVRALTVRLGELAEGRSALAFVTEGFAPATASDRERRLPDFQGIARAASRFNVAVHTFDPSTPAERADVAPRLAAIAADTGGATASGDQLPEGLRRFTRDLDVYYVVTLQPAVAAEGRFHRLDVTTKRRGAVVRMPAGYWAPITLAARAEPAPKKPARLLRRSALIRTWVGLARLADGRIRLRVTWAPAAAGRTSLPPTLAVRAAASSGPPLFEGRIAAVGGAAADAPQLAEFIVPTGRVELDLAVLTTDGKIIDSDSRDVEVPEAGKLRAAAMIPEVVRARTVREFLAVSVDPDAAPTPVREFRRADRLLIRAPTLAADGSHIAITARLLNRWGQPMRDLSTLPGGAAGTIQFDLPLAWLAPGEYEIELRSTDGGAHAAQRIPLKVSG